MATSPTLVYLADLTHTGQIVASNVAPLGIGLLASYLKQHHDGVSVELFKYPSDLSAALDRRIPELIGFANYSWNFELAYQYAERIKAVSPKTPVVFGGPNYGITDEEVEHFWKYHPAIDFYVVFEGEVAFSDLLKKLVEFKFDVERLKQSGQDIGNSHYLSGGLVKKGTTLPRIKDLKVLGSPYLQGLMDKFFDGVLIPMIHTTRGCPFTCTFCSEGNAYYAKVSQQTDLRDELIYIAEKRATIQDLVITDANFGMFKEDTEKAKVLAEIQEEYQWPKRIFVSTGKNNKERIIETVSLLNGAVSVAASLQSTNEAVLKNIKRSNISAEALNVIVKHSSEVDAPTYTEIILGLPGDSVEAHTKSLRDVTNSGFGIVRMYQLILLPQTELNTPATRRQYSMKTKFRINPRSFGRYQILGKTVTAVETEEICVANSTMTEADYYECRELDLSVEILHNTGMFVELLGLCKALNEPWFDFLLRFHSRRHDMSPRMKALYDDFTASTKSRLWDSHHDVVADVSANIEKYLDDPAGTNEMATSKAVAFFELQDEFHSALFSDMENLLKAKGLYSPTYALYLRELAQFSQLRKGNLVKVNEAFEGDFHFDFDAIRNLVFQVEPAKFLLDKPIQYQFRHSSQQRAMMESYINQYGTTLDGLGRILMRAPVKSLFRDIRVGRSEGGGLTMASFG